MPDPLVVLSQVSKQYATRGGVAAPVLRNVDLVVNPGDQICLTGPSGCGKSTLLDIIGTLLQPTSGSYLFMGQPTGNLTPRELGAIRNRHMGFVFQSFHLLHSLSVLENVCLPARFRPRRERATLRAMSRSILADLGMADLGDRRPAQLSGGQQQRVAVARALVGNPALVLADEPTGNLDPETAALVMDTLIGMCGGSRALVIVTHDAGMAARFRSRIALRSGHVVAAA